VSSEFRGSEVALRADDQRGAAHPTTAAAMGNSAAKASVRVAATFMKASVEDYVELRNP